MPIASVPRNATGYQKSGLSAFVRHVFQVFLETHAAQRLVMQANMLQAASVRLTCS